MSDYALYIEGNISLSDYSIIEDYMRIVGDRDKITISLNDKSSEEIQMICQILSRDNFEIKSKSESISGKLSIEAFKKK
ncbi:MAG: hypothetical protein RSB70_04685 [Clostridium sp.]